MTKDLVDPTANRLDAIIRLLIEFSKETVDINVGDVILILQSSGLKRVEIAKILGIQHTSIPGMVESVKNVELKKRLQKSEQRAKRT